MAAVGHNTNLRTRQAILNIFAVVISLPAGYFATDRIQLPIDHLMVTLVIVRCVVVVVVVAHHCRLHSLHYLTSQMTCCTQSVILMMMVVMSVSILMAIIG